MPLRENPLRHYPDFASTLQHNTNKKPPPLQNNLKIHRKKTFPTQR